MSQAIYGRALPERDSAAVDTGHSLEKGFGLAVAAAIPALFWTAAVETVGLLTGHPLGSAVLLAIAATIFAFAGFIGYLFTIRGNQD